MRRVIRCDTCGEKICRPEDGMLEWQRTPDGKCRGYRIVHHPSASPRTADPEGCYTYTKKTGGCENHLQYYVGRAGLLRMFATCDWGHNTVDYTFMRAVALLHSQGAGNPHALDSIFEIVPTLNDCEAWEKPLG